MPVPGTTLVRRLAGGLLLAALLTGCGDESVSDGSEREPDTASDANGDTSAAPRLTARTASETVLDDGRAALALLSQTNVGALFLSEASTDELPETSEASEPPTEEEMADCYSDLSFEDRLDPAGLAVGDAAADYAYFDETRLMIVSSRVASFGDETAAAAAIDTLFDNVGECTHFEDDEEGIVTVLDLEVSTETSDEESDTQFAMIGGGSWGEGTESVPVGMGFSATRVDNNITMVMLLSLGYLEDNALVAPYTDLSIDRLLAVAAGETPEEVVGPTPTTVPPSRVPGTTDPSQLDRFLGTTPGFIDAR